mgnify:CR=1 FL=1
MKKKIINQSEIYSFDKKLDYETIKQEIDIEYINEHLINIDDYETQAIIGKYRKSNTSIDDVLDKINNQGIETLDVIDLEILLQIT